MKFRLIFFVISFIHVDVYAQIDVWDMERNVRQQEITSYKKRFNYFKEKKILDSCLYYLVATNKHLEPLKAYKAYFSNIRKINFYANKTAQYQQGLDITQKALSLYSDLKKENVSDSTLKFVNISLDRLYFDMSNFCSELGAWNLALEYMRKYLQIRQRLYGFNNKFVAHAYNSLGIVYQRVKAYKKALSCYQKSIDIFTLLFGKKSKYLRYPLSNIGLVYMELSRYSESLNHLKKSLELSLNKEGVSSGPLLASDYEDIGGVYDKTGLKDLALENYTKALTLREKHLGKKHPYVSASCNQLGSLFQKQLKFGKALKFYQKALVSNISNFHDTLNIYALPANIENAYSKGVLLRTLNAKASLLAQLKSQKTNTEQAYQTYKLADQLVDKMRKNLLRKKDELRLTERVAAMYEKAMQVCWQLGKHDTIRQKKTSEGKSQVPNEQLKVAQYNKYLKEAFYFAEKGKTSVLRKLATDASARIKSNIPQALLEKERKLNGSILYYQRQVDRLKRRKTLNKQDSVQQARFENRVFDLRRKYDDLLRGLEQDYPDYYDLKHSNYVASVADVQNRLDKQTALIEYTLTDKQLYIFVITQEGYWVHRQVADKKEIEKEIKRWSYNIDGVSTNSYLTRGFRFFKQFIQPIEKYLATKKHLLIIPDGLLSRLPFDAFVTKKEEGNDKHNYAYLIRKWGVTLYPSASLALMQEQRKDKTYTSDFMGFAPVFKQQYAQNGIFKRNLSTLPYTKKEVENIHQLFVAQKKNSEIFIGEQVSERMIKNLQGRYRFVHFATHGLLDDKTPILAFYPDQKTDSVQSNDGELSLEEIFNLKFKADMVVLSSCKGWAGRNVKGEGILAITRGFVYLGTPHIIYTLWSVNDKDAAELMIRFYRLLSKGQSYREALRLAKLSMLKSPATAWPKWWAGFTMMSKMK